MFVFYMLQLGPANYSLPLANIKKDKILLKHSLPQGPVMQQTVPGPLQKKKKVTNGCYKMSRKWSAWYVSFPVHLQKNWSSKGLLFLLFIDILHKTVYGKQYLLNFQNECKVLELSYSYLEM